ncbi:conserved hypothetical protein [Gloeothece citriformis PCC 7424]|uniref:GTP-binding protein n=1 Tax=Gloeothece citriformis (strain PCC 7424) TaxID=65393 RepID=B7KJE0_GLOC7|nr:hypothetical protein [Gloeothece citriformis]ACK72224.1 conserved hypothetical protein [Gloeothece citriformis PCC 7424]
MITAVIGLPGSGKTYWIGEQIARQETPVLYFSPKTESIPIDSLCLQNEFPHLQILSLEQENEEVISSLKKTTAYIEIPWYLDLLGIEPLLQELNCHRVALMPPGSQNTGWHAWVDEVIPGNNFEYNQHNRGAIADNNDLKLHRAILTGEVLDFASLKTFWDELIGGAYGTMIRVKAIFDLADGQSIFGEFIHNLPPKDFKALNVQRWLEGRPQRFSGIEIVGCNLDKNAMVETLEDCCLSDLALNHYQQQIKESLESELE